MTIEIKIPELRFNEFNLNSSYSVYAIKDVAEINIARDLRIEIFSDVQTPEYNYPVFSNTVENRGLYGFYKFPEFSPNSLTVVGRGAGLGTAFSRHEAFGAIGRLLILSPKENKFDVDYLAQYINTQLKIHIESGGIPQLPGSTFGQYKIILPSFEEQKKVAKFLSSLDLELSLLTKKYDLLTDFKKGVMQKLFKQEVRFKNESGNSYPDWNQQALGQICQIKKGSQLNKDEMIHDAEFPVLNGGISFSGYTNKWNTDANTIAISEGGNSCGYVSLITQKYWSGGHCYSLNSLSENIQTQYLFQFLKYRQDNLMRLRVGSGLPNIQKKSLSKFSIQLPCPDEQHKIASFLCALDKKILNAQRQLNLTKQYKKSILQKMFI